MARYDCVIVGTGPAGLEAALNLQIRNKSFLLLGNKELSRKINIAPKINNYLGFPDITGVDLSTVFQNHLQQLDISIEEEMVSSVYHMGDHFALATQHNIYEATSVILAPGVLNSRTFPGEDLYLGQGVGYCATCDAPLYKGKTVIIVGQSNGSVQEANFVAEIAKKVYFIPIGKPAGTLDDSIEVINDRVQEIQKENNTMALVLREQKVIADGIFILRDAIAPSSLVPGLETEGPYIKVDTKMNTNLPGLFAAGDCTGLPHQYMKAAGEGLVAAFSAVEFLDNLEKK